MAVKVTLDNWDVDAKLDAIATNNGLGEFGANEMLIGMDKYVPYEAGDLSGDAIAEPFGVVYTVPYSHYQYGGVDFKHTVDQHPLAMAKWDEGFKAAKMSAFEQSLEDYIRYKL